MCSDGTSHSMCNLANARSVASSESEAYRAIKPVFKTITQMIWKKPYFVCGCD